MLCRLVSLRKLMRCTQTNFLLTMRGMPLTRLEIRPRWHIEANTGSTLHISDECCNRIHKCLCESCLRNSPRTSRCIISGYMGVSAYQKDGRVWCGSSSRTIERLHDQTVSSLVWRNSVWSQHRAVYNGECSAPHQVESRFIPNISSSTSKDRRPFKRIYQDSIQSDLTPQILNHVLQGILDRRVLRRETSTQNPRLLATMRNTILTEPPHRQLECVVRQQRRSGSNY